MKKDNCMNDLETMDTIASAVIISIGAVMFDADGLHPDEFYEVINYQSCIDAGLTVSVETEKWWEKQRLANPDAYKTVAQAKAGEGIDLKEGLIKLSEWYRNTGFEAKLYGNGADFDNAILNSAYRAVGLNPPWSPWSGRCYRTLKSIFNGVIMNRSGQHHNALDDAKSQALHLIDIVKAYGFPLN